MQGIGISPAVPRTKVNPVVGFFEGEAYFQERNLRITGVTRDGSGTPLAGCKVVLFDAATNTAVDSNVSDSGGNYILQIPTGYSQTQATTFYVVAYLSGSPDVAGTTVKTLVGA